MDVQFITVVGSKLYNIANEESDTDIKGFAIPSLEYIIGMKKFEQEESSNGMTGRDKVESVIYNLDKYLKLAASGNPTIIELAFAYRVKGVLKKETELARMVNEFIRNHLITNNIFNAYHGYFKQQVSKLNRSDNRQGKRQALIDKYGYDVKFAAHAYRLAHQFCQLARDRFNFSPALDGDVRDFIMHIKSGRVPYDFMMNTLDTMKIRMEFFNQLYKLPIQTNSNIVHDFYFDIMKEYLKGKI